jgi:hypothetical protein
MLFAVVRKLSAPSSRLYLTDCCRPRFGLAAFLVFLASLFSSHIAMAQELVPRAYLIAPIGSNAINVVYSHLEGDLQFNDAVPITGATANVNLTAFSYYRSLDVLGRTANVAVVIPYGNGNFQGTAIGVPKSAYRSGLLDSFVRFSVNLLGGPAMQLAEFAKWRQDFLLGISLQISAPTGQYDPTVLINWGSNRWTFKPELGYSQRWGSWLVDAYVGGTFFTTNPEFFSHNMYFAGDQSQSVSPVGSVEAHVSYDFKRRLWVSLDGNFWRGGASSLNGVQNPATDQKSSRIGVTGSVPITRRQSLKMSYSQGAYVRYGGNYRNVTLGWQYGWIDSSRMH